ncbi:hypothetical protein OG413_43905 [Streptomyces sp. NBC_01433]|uniref:hypothetical protein n=1 Tax=Streptomyces sp. NBC_01433 TaxID=2903864 RepID=UPI00225A1309|nr:hypothetical protein [Streptomyces sp. NBC_01433]MCX4682130.1 hypothetical protein [Streptomyces sp. NBC_01433]
MSRSAVIAHHGATGGAQVSRIWGRGEKAQRVAEAFASTTGPAQGEILMRSVPRPARRLSDALAENTLLATAPSYLPGAPIPDGGGAGVGL